MDSHGKGRILQERETAQRKSHQKSGKENGKDIGLECRPVWLGDVDNAKRRHKKTGDLGDVDLGKNGQSHLDGEKNQWRITAEARGKKITGRNNKRMADKMDRTHPEKWHLTRRHHRGKNGGEKNRGQIKNNAAGVDDDKGGMHKTEKGSREQRRMATLDIETSRKAENIKKKKKLGAAEC
jgi:hypothetical protein